ncbi:uncharacterized protein LOC135805060 [Sycon ciliatum]|uniref:uncharacterized protein LOC135805060 n=1 Tax=Sycon ciliatum TaxID=27933 RepID=UPI0020AE7BD8|eukprot:scpid42717/ scgid11742/ Chondroitin sulfate synthase 2; Chondroitin glucuronyltransferase 2; Chondroitin-polymerizing factor; Glucuronosyl-N-acetylgalactosaminyl-proteoglycan 4-beta-N-acetylgalactosaminyltransferase II; N-acetylgalactosaminyl-proteoglycan 3-beta-glucuronosyltransferase II; N-acetylgalactosaminyltransferase 2
MRKLGFLSCLMVLFRRGKPRQVGNFILGAILGLLIHKLIPRDPDNPPLSRVPKDDVAKSRWEYTVAFGKLEETPLAEPARNLSQLLVDARRPRRLSSRKKILRHANDEVRMFKMLSPLVYHTNDGLSAAAASTWFQDFAPDSRDVELFGPQILGTLLRQMTGVGSLKTHVVQKPSLPTASGVSRVEHFVTMLESVCDSVTSIAEATASLNIRSLPTLLAFKWFALTHDTSYIHLEKMAEFLSHVESTGPVCLARPRPHTARVNGMRVWSSQPGFLLNQRAAATLCPYLPQFSKHLVNSLDKEATFSSLLLSAGVNCSSPGSEEDDPYFVDLQSVQRSPSALGREALETIPGLRNGLIFSVKSELEMYLLRKSVHLGEMQLLARKVRTAYDTLQNMQQYMREHPLALTEMQTKTSTIVVSGGKIEPSSSDQDIVWMSSDPMYQLSANFNGLAGHQRASAFAKDVERQLEVACQHLSKQEDSLRCVSMVSAYVRFRPGVGLEYMYNLLAKSSQVSANNAKPLHQTVQIVRPLQSIKVVSVYELDTQSRMYVIVPLVAHSPFFKQFMAMYERKVLALEGNVVLIVAHFPDVLAPDNEAAGSKGVADARTLLSLYQSKYKDAEFRWVDVPGKVSNAAAAVRAALQEVGDDAAVFVTHLSFTFSMQFLGRCRVTARPGHQSYLPMAQVAATDGSPTLGSHCKLQEGICAFKSDIVQSGWLTASSSSSSSAFSIDSLSAALKERLHLVQAVDPDLTC